MQYTCNALKINKYRKYGLESVICYTGWNKRIPAFKRHFTQYYYVLVCCMLTNYVTYTRKGIDVLHTARI
jgi:hypothetical protein